QICGGCDDEWYGWEQCASGAFGLLANTRASASRSAQPLFLVTNDEPNSGLESLLHPNSTRSTGHSSEFTATSVTITTNSIVHFSPDAISETDNPPPAVQRLMSFSTGIWWYVVRHPRFVLATFASTIAAL